MKAIILIIGSEFTKGLKQDKNSLFIAKKLFQKGIDIEAIITTSDDIYNIQTFLKIALDKADIVFTSGGLGATSDDLTREAISEAIGVPLIFNEDWLKKLKEDYKKAGLDFTEERKKMAKLPYNAKPIENPIGKALGFIKVLDDVQKAIVALPGVPSEMKAMLKIAFDYLGLKEDKGFVYLFRTYGKSEIKIDELTKDIDKKIINASPKGVDLFIYDNAKEFLENKVAVLRERLGNLIYAEDEIEMEEVVGKLLKEKGYTISTAESSTGGMIATRIVNVPGSSAYFKGSVVSYANEVKENILKVNKEDLEKLGAVSEPVGRQMAEGVKKLLNTDFALSDTGIAGPTGGTKEKPVGLHYIGMATPSETIVEKVIFSGERNDIRLRVSQHALNMLRLYLLKQN
ncbi:CinA family nicotinamide mononucleotide deamidase-related protein [Hydrogenothermus marinus]|uniref:CinA-like protein n=1 Tax=Hydrogenothermus marinus TaxID=133270 RepID=A0A3M0BL62_9AQUI|nr:CinA family nicotinamide mononucleotide deamidase-related protein [Hydrogenothermus marinus]RMA97316.1 nicotinamide-nucleotide amidase [Hydrogenothermus marinus]